MDRSRISGLRSTCSPSVRSLLSLAYLSASLSLARRSAHRSAAVKGSFIFALFSDAESRVVFAPGLPAFALLLVDTGMTMVYNDTTSERNNDEFVVLEAFHTLDDHARPTDSRSRVTRSLPRGPIIDRDGTIRLWLQTRDDERMNETRRARRGGGLI